jgi:hypothetical protein
MNLKKSKNAIRPSAFDAETVSEVFCREAESKNQKMWFLVKQKNTKQVLKFIFKYKGIILNVVQVGHHFRCRNAPEMFFSNNSFGSMEKNNVKK